MENNVSKVRKGSVQATAEVEVLFLNSYFIANIYKNIMRCAMAQETLAKEHTTNEDIRNIKEFLVEIAKALEA